LYSLTLVPLPKKTVGRVRAVLIKVLSNDDKEDEKMTIKEEDDKDDNDVRQLITEQTRRTKS